MSEFIRLQKQCPNCKKIFKQRIIGDRLEYPSIFKKKTYCSLICGGIANAAKKKLQAEQRA